MKLNKVRYVKFLVVGVIGTIPNYIIYMFLRHIEFKMSFIVLNIGWISGIMVGATSNYILNEVWTFD